MPSIYGEYSKYTRLRIDYSISQSINENKSTISMTMYAERTKASQQAYTNSIYNMTGKGDTKFTYNWSSSSYELEIGTSSVTITHNPDGTASTTLEGYWNTRRTGSSYIPQELWISQTITLPTIPRTSKISLSTNSVTLGNAITITTNRASSSFTHALYWQIGSGSWNLIKSGVTTSHSWTVPLEIANSFPNAPTSPAGTINVICETYNGSTYLGSSFANLSVTIPDSILPWFSSGINISGGINGVFVETLSNVSISFTASGAYNSTIMNYKIEMWRDSTKLKEYSSNTTPSTTFNLNNLGITDNKDIQIKCYITDSRGRTASTASTINVKRYVPPIITNKTVYRCNSSGARDDNNGTYLYVYWAYSTKSISGVTSDIATVQYKRKDASTWNPISVGNEQAAIIGGGGISVDYQWEVKFTISDNYKTDTYTATISTGYSTIDFKAGGKGFAIGKASEVDEFEVAMPATFYEGNDFKAGNYFRGHNRYFVEQFFEQGISFNNVSVNNVNYNDVHTSGVYYMGEGCSNAPENHNYCKLFSMGAAGSGDLAQIASNVVTANSWIRGCSNGEWHNWKQIGISDDKSAQVSTPGWYRIAKMDGTGHYPNNAAVLNIYTGYNNNSPCSVLASVITSYKDARMTQLTAINTNGAVPMLTGLRVQYDYTNGGFYIDVYYLANTQNPIRVRNESITNTQIKLFTPELVSTEFTTVDQFDIDYTGTNLRPRMILTAKPSSRVTITGTEWTPTVIPLDTVHGPNLSDGKLGISNGGIIIGSEVKKIKVSASVSYYQYSTTGETDLAILKNSGNIGEIMSTCPHADQIVNITSNTVVVDVTEGDLIKLAIIKGSSNSMTILDTRGATSLTVEAIG